MESGHTVDTKTMSQLATLGKGFIYPERQQEWENFVVGMATGEEDSREANLSTIREAVKIMEALHYGALPETIEEKLIKESQTLSGASSMIVKNIVLRFSPHGPEFYRATVSPLNQVAEALVARIEEENARIIAARNKEAVTETPSL